MAAAPPSNPEPTSSSGDADASANFSFQDRVLTWIGGTLHDDDVITVTKVEGSRDRFTIFSLAPADAAYSNPESSLKPPPFELRVTPARSLPEEFYGRHLFQALPAQLDPSDKDLHILISTLSGTGLAPAFFDKVLQGLLHAIGLEASSYNVVKTKSAESVTEFARSVLLVGANNSRKQTVLMLSGDGGMVDLVNALLGNGERASTYVKPALSQIPLGTGNALFHSLHRGSSIPSIYVQGLRTLLYGKQRSLPLFQATFSPGARILSNEGRTATPLLKGVLYGVVVASYGLHATLVADSDTTEYRKHGDKRFGLVAKDLLFPENGDLPHAYLANLTLFKPGGQTEVLPAREHGYILASLVSNLERTFTISPSSKPLDGQLRVVHFGTTSGTQAMEIMKEAYNSGNHVGMEWESKKGRDKVGYEDVEGLRIDFQEKGVDWKWRRCCVDGLIVGVEEGGWMEVRRVESDCAAVEIVFDS